MISELTHRPKVVLSHASFSIFWSDYICDTCLKHPKFWSEKRLYYSMRNNSRKNSKRIEKFRDARSVRENSRALLPIPFAI